jgi:hypothetical protein
MIGEQVASARDLQRYKELLLEKQRELSSVQGDAAARYQPQVAWREIKLTKPMPMRKRNFRSAYTKPTLVSYEQSKRHSLGSSRVHSECARYASSLSLRVVWKRCPGRGSAVNAKNASTPPLDTGNIGFEPPMEIGNSTWIVRVEVWPDSVSANSE